MSKLKCRTIWKSGTQRWMMMMMPCRLVLGLLVLNMVLAFPPRNPRQADPDNYDDDLDKMDVEYYDELTTEEPEIEISTLSPDEDYSPAHGASLEEEEEETEEELEKENVDKTEFPITPSLFPSGSGVPGVLTGPDTPGEEELRLTPTETLHISGDFLGSGFMLSSGGSGASGASGISGEIPDAREYHSGELLGSGGSGGLISGGSADVSSGDISSEGSVDFGSGVSGDLVLGANSDFASGVSSGMVSGVSGDFVSGVSGDFVSGASGDLVSGTSGDLVSGTSGDIVSGTSGDFVSGISGDLVSGVSGDFVSGVSGDFVCGVSEDFVSGVSGDFVSGVSGDLVSGVSGDFVSGASGEVISGASGDFVSGDSGEVISGASGEVISGASGEVISGASGEVISGASGEVISGASGEVISGASGEVISGDTEEPDSTVSGDSGSGPPAVTFMPGREEEFYTTVTPLPEEFSGRPEISGVPESPPVTSGPPEQSGYDEWVTIPTHEEEEELSFTTQTPHLEGTGSTTGSGLPKSPEPDDEIIDIDVQGMSTCILCTCLGGSVYCDDVKLVNVPPLPKDTTHFYARYNRITKINKSDFANMNKLKRIDLTSNAISKIDDDALFGLPALEELVIRENSLAQLPALPATMTLVDASHNYLGRTGIQNEAFKEMTGLLYLYLTDNGIDHIPIPLPESLRSLHLQNNNIQIIHEDTFCKLNDFSYMRMALEDIRLDGNPVILSRTPQAYVCLPRIPVGALI
ncbi:epiphycan [Hemibagrus wyckioides]|uniref:epiphycan n=1 Tax=Hemibagrus wyckioides TaxID=337641 RepID=UPI00266D4F7E|nr:epiphycan [Hemibagrus wyckioides]